MPNSPTRLSLALAIAAVSDLISVFTLPLAPVQWVLDIGTALLLFAVLGRRWMLLPGLIAEAIPGLEVLPFWVLVVASIGAYDRVQGRAQAGAAGEVMGPAGTSTGTGTAGSTATATPAEDRPRKRIESEVR